MKKIMLACVLVGLTLAFTFPEGSFAQLPDKQTAKHNPVINPNTPNVMSVRTNVDPLHGFKIPPYKFKGKDRSVQGVVKPFRTNRANANKKFIKPQD